MASAVQVPIPVWLKAEDLQCSICLDLLSNPATVECGHSFCLGCIRECLKKLGSRECPICKHRVGCKLSEISSNVLLKSILEKYNLAFSDPLPAKPGFPDGARSKRDFSLARRDFQDYILQTRSSISEAFSFMKKCICEQEEMVLRIIEEEWKVAQQITDSTDKLFNGKNHNILDLQKKFEEVKSLFQEPATIMKLQLMEQKKCSSPVIPSQGMIPSRKQAALHQQRHLLGIENCQ